MENKKEKFENYISNINFDIIDTETIDAVKFNLKKIMGFDFKVISSAEMIDQSILQLQGFNEDSQKMITVTIEPTKI